MSNYKWVTCCKSAKDVRNSHCATLCTANFQSLHFPAVSSSSVNSLLEKVLNKAGIVCDPDEFSFLGKVHSFYLLPITPKFIEITAPLYRVHSDGTHEKISDSYTDKTIDPAQYDWVKEEFNRCQEEVQQQ